MSSPDLARAPAGRRGLTVGAIRLLYHPRAIAVTAALVVVALAAAVVVIAHGSVAIPVNEVPAALFGASEDSRAIRVVQQIRAPRALTALAAGAALGCAGAIFQSLSRNALGSPDVIGFTTGAATGAIGQIVLLGGSPGQVALGAVIGGLVTAGIVLVLARRHGAVRGPQLVLVGIGVGAVLAALNALMLVKGDLDSAIEATLWLAGSLDARTWDHALPALVAVAVLLPLTALLARRAELLELGDDLARQLGVGVERTRLALVVLGVGLTAAATAACGPIAFVALASPQLVRRLSRSRSLPVWSAGAMGAALLICADLISLYLPLSLTMPIGRMTGIVGGLYLIWLLLPSRTRALT